ncbi:hypothetical protein HOG47_08525 [archaeon]|jgi:hypothetical protein|nr:hypothetical protein [archaeon]
MRKLETIEIIYLVETMRDGALKDKILLMIEKGASNAKLSAYFRLIEMEHDMFLDIRDIVDYYLKKGETQIVIDYLISINKKIDLWDNEVMALFLARKSEVEIKTFVAKEDKVYKNRYLESIRILLDSNEDDIQKLVKERGIEC